MQTLMIVGAGYEQVPAIKMARDMGCKVVATDYNPQAPGFAFADEYAVVSTTDFEGNLEVARRQNIDGVMTLISETAVVTVARVAEAMKLPGLSVESAYLATNKNAMKQALKQQGVSVSPFAKVRCLEEVKDFAKSNGDSWVVKPSDSSGQRGVTWVKELEQLEVALDRALQFSKDSYAIIEEFVSGPEINVTAMINGGNIEILSLSHRITADPPYFGVALQHLAPTNLDRQQQDEVVGVAKDAIRGIGIEDGIAYPQIILSPQGAKLVEIAARIPGGHMREVAMYQSGIDMIRVAILQALGSQLNREKAIAEETYPAIAVRFITALDIPGEKKIFQSITGLENAKNIEGIKECYVRLKPGEPVPIVDGNDGRFGAIIAVGQEPSQVICNTEEALKFLQFSLC